jgi:hypothetical protein
MGAGTYLGFPGLLYPASNAPPPGHAADGLARAALVVPRDTAGNPAAGGRIVLLSIGMSNTTQEYCAPTNPSPCTAWSFAGQAAADPAVDHTTLAIVNGAAGGKSAAFWDSPTDPDYGRVLSSDLAPLGLTEAQVQAAWVKVANPGPTQSLPSASADAYTLETQMGNIVRALKTRYPNLALVYFSSRIYAGYAQTPLNPEPYAYESGFAVKWIVGAQIAQQDAGGAVVDPRAGDLGLAGGAPWIGWGPYLWADGPTPRSDGLVWLPGDLSSDGTHPSSAGQQKVGAMLLSFFKADPTSRSWFLASIAPSPLTFTALAPCRVLDTRAADGPLGGPALAAGSARTFTIAGTCAVPSDAKAISANVTVTQATAPGSLALAPGGASPGGTVSYSAGQTRANNVLLALDAAGALDAVALQPSGSVHVVLDVNGAFR